MKKLVQNLLIAFIALMSIFTFLQAFADEKITSIGELRKHDEKMMEQQKEIKKDQENGGLQSVPVPTPVIRAVPYILPLFFSGDEASKKRARETL
jgi:hypothetical protein